MGTLVDFVKKKTEEIDSELAGLTDGHLAAIKSLVEKDFGFQIQLHVDFSKYTILLKPNTSGAVVKMKRTDKIDKYLDFMPKVLGIPQWTVSFA